VGCTAEATAGARMAGSPDVADVPTVPEQVVFADRYGSAVYRLPQPAIANHPKSSKRNFNAPVMARYCRTPSSITEPTYAQKRNLRLPTCPLLRCPPESGVNSSEDTQTHRAKRKPPPRRE
jgi:hypothetical protein